MDASFKPSEVVLSTPPLTGTMDRTEVEIAAAVMIVALRSTGDTWRPILPREIGEAIKRELDAGAEPLTSWNRSPFMRPDFWDLVARGFARFTGEDPKTSPMELTPAAIAALSRWVRPRSE